MKDLSNADVEKLCRTNKSFFLFCKKFHVMNKRAQVELKKLAPLGELLDTPQKQLLAVQRGQVTPYI